MKIAYFDCFAGASGDMILGSLIDAGLDADRLTAELAKLPLTGYEISAKKVLKNGVSGTRFHVAVSAQDHSRGLADILKILEESSLGEAVKKTAADIFKNIARVEASIHNIPVDEVHFHEIGAVDSIIDIAGACIAINLLDIRAVYASRINVGEGFIDTIHGRLPVPAPATAGLLTGVPIYSSGIEAELTTPTGAAIISYFAKRFGPLPEIKIMSTGYGAGAMDLPVPNLLRLYIGESEERAGYESIVSIETNIDDMNPEFYQHVFERLLDAGALDVYTTPVMMKKSRPGVKLTVLAGAAARDALADIIFSETTTGGIRFSVMERIILDREVRRIHTRYGEISVKVFTSAGRVVTVSPEYEDCKRIARTMDVPLKQVYDEAKKIADSLHGRGNK
ncbi:MAG: TIGR00299 family protein [Spirochaetes bacterium RBG_13_51_14]|nr:MAG: TIGR00299 family protein [Spirochaetes bacterium RBG_13_51_14]